MPSSLNSILSRNFGWWFFLSFNIFIFTIILCSAVLIFYYIYYNNNAIEVVNDNDILKDLIKQK